MIEQELKKFADMVRVYDHLCDVKVWEQDDVEKIEKLSDSGKYDAIEALYNEDEEFTTADEMMLEHFGHDTESLNILADEFDYQRIA